MGSQSKKTRKSGKTLQTAREAGYFGKKLLKKGAAAEAEGKPLGWSMVTWWQGELIAEAFGINLVFPENYGALCAAVGQAEQYLEISQSEGFPTTLCGYAQNCFGYAKRLKDNGLVPPTDAPGGGLPKPIFLLGSGAACDARIKWFQALNRYLDNTPIWILDIPQTGASEFLIPGNKELSIKFIAGHLRSYVAFLEDLLNTKLDYDRLKEIVDQTYKTMHLAYEVDKLRRAKPSPMVSTDFWSIMIAHLFLPFDPEAYAFYERVYDEVKSKVDNGIEAIPNERYRMLFGELPPIPGWWRRSFTWCGKRGLDPCASGMDPWICLP